MHIKGYIDAVQEIGPDKYVIKLAVAHHTMYQTVGCAEAEEARKLMAAQRAVELPDQTPLF